MFSLVNITKYFNILIFNLKKLGFQKAKILKNVYSRLIEMWLKRSILNLILELINIKIKHFYFLNLSLLDVT